jgi:transglutaminase-like putative cysteine protease
VDVDVHLMSEVAEDPAPAAPELLAASEPFDFRDAAFAPALRAIAGRRQPAPAETGHRIVDWVAERVRSEATYSAGQRSALAVLRDGRGDCSERMALVVALCRRAGLPARGVGGVTTVRDRVVRAPDYHDWALYFDGARWRLADPGAREPVSWDRYVAFEWIDGNPQKADDVRRFRAVGAGVVAQME